MNSAFIERVRLTFTVKLASKQKNWYVFVAFTKSYSFLCHVFAYEKHMWKF